MDLKALLSSPILNLLSLGLAVVGIVLACVFFRKSRRLREPSWAMRTINLIEGYSAQLDDLEVSFRGQRVKNLSISRIAFWNQGAETINGSDMPVDSPLKIIAKDARILDVRILQVNHPSCKFSVQLADDGTGLLGMDYCDHGQGVVLQIIHTGIGVADIALTGIVKGARPLSKRETVPPQPRPIGAGILLGSGMIGVAYMEPNGPADPFMIALGGVLLIGVALIAGKQWLNRLPSGLEMFEDVSFGLQSGSVLKVKHKR